MFFYTNVVLHNFTNLTSTVGGGAGISVYFELVYARPLRLGRWDLGYWGDGMR